MDHNFKVKLYHRLALISTAIMSYLIANISHEAVGHGGACLIAGGKITLLTSVYFRSKVHSYVTDAFGPLANLAAGLLLWMLLLKVKGIKFYTKLFFV